MEWVYREVTLNCFGIFGEPFKMIMTAEQLKPASVEELQQNLSNERLSGRSKGFLGPPRKCDLSKCKPQKQDLGWPSKYAIIFLHVIDGKESKQNKQKTTRKQAKGVFGVQNREKGRVSISKYFLRI